MEVFIVAEHNEGELALVSFELLHLANMIKGNGKSNAVIFGKNAGKAGEPLTEYADKVWVIEDSALENPNPELNIEIITQVVGNNKPAIVLFGETPLGKETAPYLAAKLNTPVQTDVISVDVSDDVVISKYMCQGKVKIDMALKKSEIYVLTVRQRVFKEGPKVNGTITEVVDLKSPIVPRRNFVKFIEPEVGAVDILNEEIIVTVGKGLGDESKMSIAEDLARLLGGVTAGTRPAIDYGWLPIDRQVGVSGKVINPKIYFGLGVSGASQHVLGMKDSDLIIAINKDPEAPIFGVAQYCIVGDMFEILPAIIAGLQDSN